MRVRVEARTWVVALPRERGRKGDAGVRVATTSAVVNAMAIT
jgi:hypothetical protein